ncbi:MAG: regulatory protein RecX [Syntrophales bacterium]|nr:regulatory protein RecX [Syntrophales bacterium]
MEDDLLLERAREKAFRFLSIRARSRKELRARLKEKGFDNPVVDRVLDYLLERGYLDDASFARQWARNLAVNRLLGNRRIEMSLREKGIPSELIGEAVAGAREEISEREAIGKLIGKKGKDRKVTDPKELRRLGRSLVGKGFPPGLVFDILETAGEESLCNDESDGHQGEFFEIL